MYSTYSYYRYNYVSSDYLCHYGVPGMKWGQHLMNRWEQSRENKRAIKAEKKATLKSYRTDKGPRSGLVNASNSAARSYYRAQNTGNFKTYRKETAAADRKEASLSTNQVKGGRYRVARARNIKSKVATVAVGSLVGATTAAAVTATGGLVIAASLGIAAAAGTRQATHGSYYAKEQKAYGSKRAKNEATETVKKRNSEY